MLLSANTVCDVDLFELHNDSTSESILPCHDNIVIQSGFTICYYAGAASNDQLKQLLASLAAHAFAAAAHMPAKITCVTLWISVCLACSNLQTEYAKASDCKQSAYKMECSMCAPYCKT